MPRGGYWREMINTNSDYYAGTGVGNDGGRTTDDLPSDGHAQSLLVTLPPLSTVIFKWQA